MSAARPNSVLFTSDLHHGDCIDLDRRTAANGFATTFAHAGGPTGYVGKVHPRTPATDY